MPHEARRGLDLSWLVTLRWGALAGQLVTILAVDRLMGIALPLGPLAAILAVGVASNVALAAWRRRAEVEDRMLAAVMLLDVVLLTAVLYFTGGPFNPFSFLYLVNVALAAVILPPGWTWALAVASSALFGALFFAHVPLPIADHGMGHDHAAMSVDHPISLHVQGMWFAFAVAAVFIVYFIQRVRSALAARDAELADVLRAATRHEKLASLATLAAGAAHELATPLSTIAVVAKELERTLGVVATDSAAADARLIREQVQRCRDILDHMAADAGESAGEAPAVTTVAVLVAAATDGLAAAARLDVECAAMDAAWTCAPPRAVAQALRGVLKNALEASTEDVAVRVAPASAAGGPAWRLVVADRGAGMTADVLAHAGEPFFTTKNGDGVTRGMGLGLFLARVVLERLGGSLEIESTLGRGTTVTLVLPAAAPATVRRIDDEGRAGMVADSKRAPA